VEWVPIADPDPPGQGSNDVYDQGFALGAAIFTRLEGCWYGNRAIYFDATSGGNTGDGHLGVQA
jgi:secreted PhoX family phosphatase